MRVRAVVKAFDPALRWGVGAFLLTRTIASAAAAFAVRFLEVGPTVPVPSYTPGSFEGLGAILFGTWLRSDALWYLRIATSGYETGATFAFLPMFPLLTGLLTPVFGGNELFAALFVSNAACLLGFVLLFHFFDALSGRGAARAGVIGLAVFPTAFFLVAPYAEPVLMAAGAGALVAVVRGKPWAAFACGAAAALTRPFGVLLAVPMLLIGIARGRKREAALAALGPLVGAAAWGAYVALRTGATFGAVSVQTLWQREASTPPATLLKGVEAWWTYRATDFGPYFLFDLTSALFALTLTIAVVVFLRRDHTLAAYGLGGYGALATLLPMMRIFEPRPLLSFPRFILALFPLFIALRGVKGKTRPVLAVVSGAGLFVATAVYVAARPLY